MKGRLSLGKKFLVALFAVLALFSLVAGLCLPKLFNEAYAQETTSPDYSDATKYRLLDVKVKSYTPDTSDTPDTLKENYFQVYGKMDESDAGTLIEDLSLLEVIIENGYLRTDEGNKVTIIYLPGSPDSISSDYIIEGGSVRVAQLKSVSLKVADGWTLSGGYWRKAVQNADGDTWYELSAFVAGMTQKMLFDNLVVTAEYEKSSHIVGFTYDDNNAINGTTTGEPVPTVNYPFTTTTNRVTVSFGASAAEQGSLSVNFEEEKIVAIKLNEKWKQPTTVQSSTSLSSLGLLDVGTILPIYNSGREAENYRFDPVCTIDGTLAPTAKDIQKALTDSNYKYDKTLTVNYNGSNQENVKPIVVHITGIEYVGPSSISGELGGNPVRQTAHAKFDFTGLTVTFRYGNGRVAIPLEDLNFESNIKVGYSTSGNDEYPLTELSTQVNFAKITVSFSYINDKGQRTECDIADSREIDVDPAVLSVPALKSSNGEENYDIITYSVDNCFKTLDLTGLDATALTVSFTDSQNGDAIIDVNNSSNGILTYDSATGKVSFLRSGLFVMSVTLKDGGDYVWGNPSSLAAQSGRVKKTDYELQYTLQVNKAPIDVSLVYENGANRVYGWTEETSASVSARIQGTQDPIEGMGTAQGSNLVYEFWYYKGTESAASATKDVTKIREVGNYFVLVKTFENNIYQAGQSSAVGFEITKKPISVTDIKVKTQEFKGEAYDVNDFINYNSVPFAYGDKLADIFTVSSSDTKEDKNHKIGYIHANSYTASIAFNQEKLGKNYLWSDGTTGAKSIDFTIIAREITVNASANGFTYGEVGQLNASASSDPAFVTLSQPAYYFAGGVTQPTGNSETWNAGNYCAYFTWDYAAGIVAQDGDLVLKQNGTALSNTDKRFFAEFTVGKATLTKIDFTTEKALGTYDGSGHAISSNWGSVSADLKNGNALADILAVTIEGTLTAEVADKTVTTGMSFADGSAFVTEAGTYRITVSFQDTNGNYQWADGRTEVVFEDFTVARKEISFQAFDGETEFEDLNNIFYVYNGEAHAPTVKAVSGVTVGSDVIELSLEGFTALYAKDGTELSSAPIAADEYYVLVNDFTAKQIGGAAYTYAVNFELPQNRKIVFKINSSSLQIPSLKAGGTSIEMEYKGVEYDFLDYLNGDRDYFNRLKITIMQGSTVEDLKNVYLVDGKVLAYTITVEPATNYKWEGASGEADETKAYQFTFTITQKDITVSWGENQVYTGSSITFTATAQGLCGGDDVKLNVTFKTDPVNAGDYLGIAEIIEEGVYWQNYSVNASNIFTVKKFGLATPVATDAGDLKYTGGMQSVSYGNLLNASGNSDWGLVTVSATHKLPDSYNADAAETPFKTKETFNGLFGFLNAGIYSVTFELTEEAQKNYYFGNDEKQEVSVSLADFTVERLEIELPTFGTHTYQWDGTAKQPSFTPATVQSTIDGVYFQVNFSVAYGIWDMAGNTANDEFTSRGFYYARITMQSVTVKSAAAGESTAEVYNFVWVQNGADIVDKIDKLIYGAPVTTESNGGIIYDLMYAVINSVLDFTFEIKGYTFGDNGMSGTALNIWDKDSFIRVTVTDGTEDIQSIFESEAPKIEYAFADEKGRALTPADLSNGLPWNAGKYSITIKVTFTEGSDYENLSFDKENLKFGTNTDGKEFFVVSPKTIFDGDIEFTDQTVTYDGQRHGVAVEFTTSWPQKADGSEVNLTIASEYQQNANANPYRLALILGGADKGNFVLANDITLPQLTINPREVTIHGVTNGHDSVVYGEEIPLSSFQWAYTNENGTKFIDSDIAGLNLTVMLEGYVAGQYLAVKDGGYQIGVDYTANGNYRITVVPETFRVTPRPITVTVGENAGSVYGGAVDLYGDGVITVYNKAANDDIRSIVQLTAKLNGFDASETAKAGAYAVACVLSGEKSGNYTLTFNGGNYVISNAKFSFGAIADKTETYNAQDFFVLDSAPSMEGGVRLPENDLKFFVAKKEGNEATAPAVGDTRWKSFDSVKARNVADSGVYWVLATADNHDAATTSFTFTVNPKEITVSLNFAIWYGEENPANQAGYRKSLDDLSFTLCEGDDRSVVSGSFEYAVPSYEKGKGKDGYDIGLTLNLTSANYVFVTAAKSTLTVKPLEITVNIASVSSVYGAVSNSLSAEITTPRSSYSNDENVRVELIDGRDDIFTLSTVANTDGNKAVGRYPITGTANGSKASNYSVAFQGETGKEGVYSITPATITVSFAGTDVFYNEEEQKLLNKYLANGVDGTAEITYYLAKGADAAIEITTEGAWDELTQGVTYSEVPSSVDVWSGYVYYRVFLANHATVYGSVEAQIKQANNNGAEGFKYGEANQWIYGYGGADGFDQNLVTDPTVSFKRGTNANGKTDISVAVYRGNDDKAIASNIYRNGTIDAKGLFETLYNKDSTERFTADTYRLVVSMEETDNFTAFRQVFEFEVKRRELSVKAEDQTIFYGDAAKSFKAVAVGLVSNEKDAAAETLAAVFGEEPVFITDYQQGNYTGEYFISISAENQEKYRAAAGNYNVSFPENAARITVEKRCVTVEIADKSNYYNLNKGAEAKETLTFKVTNGSFYPDDGTPAPEYTNDNQAVITLRTEAFSNRSSDIDTNDVKIEGGVNVGYSIYAVWGARSGSGRSYGEDYVIRITNASKTEIADEAIRNGDGSANAATFLILPALMTISPDKTPVGKYNGLPQEYTMKVASDATVEIVSTYVGREGTVYGSTNIAPTNVGKYTVTFSASNPNYQASGDISVNFNIDPAEVTIVPIRLGSENNADQTAWVKYGTQIFNTGAAIDGYFSGFGLKYTFVLGAGATLGTAEEIIAFETEHGNWKVGNITYGIANYSPNKNAGQNVNVFYASGITSPNFTQTTTVPGELRIDKRNVTVWVKGFDVDGNLLEGDLANDAASGVYSGESQQQELNQKVQSNCEGFFKPSDNWAGASGLTLKDLGLALTVTDARVVGKYQMNPSASSNYAETNFVIEFVKDAYYKITPAPLKIYVQVSDTEKGVSGTFTYDTTNKVYKANGFGVIYGNEASFTIAYDGFRNETIQDIRNRQEITNADGYTLNYRAGSYPIYNVNEIWGNNRGTYLVSYAGAEENALSFNNYTITYVPTQFEVARREVTAKTSSQIYTEGNGYNEGASGARLDAVIVFANADVLGVSALTQDTNYLPKLNDTYTLSYVGKRVDGQTTTIPNVAGEYVVTIAFNDNSNYTFVGGSLSVLQGDDKYVIAQKEINLSWNNSAMPEFDKLQDADKIRKIENYVQDIMDFGTEFEYIYRNVESGVYQTEKVPQSAYTYEDGFTFKAYGAGTYRIVIRLKASAQNNYTLRNETEGAVTLVLTVSTESVTLKITGINGWTYKSYDASLNTPTATVDGVAQVLPFTYARIALDYDNEQLAALKNRSFDDREFASVSSMLGITEGSFSANIPTEAGTYAVCAYYQTTGQRAYYLFKVKPMTVSVPEFLSADTMYTGSQLSLTVNGVEGVSVTARNCYVTVSGEKILIQTINSGTYEITFSLSSSNYVWTDNSREPVVKDWVIARGQDKISGLVVTGDGANASVVYGGLLNVYATSAFNGQVYYSYREKVDGKAPEEVTDGWGARPVYAKTYWVKATTEGTGNYLGATAYTEFTIHKATLTVTPYAAIIYGDAFNAGGGAGYGYDVSGFLRGDGKDVIRGSVTYSASKDADWSVTAEGVVLTVNVSGLSADNYEFVAAEGKLTVGKKTITVNIGNAEAFYTVAISADGVRMTAADNALVPGDTLAGLGLQLKVIDAQDNLVIAGAPVGSYAIVSSVRETKNYVINYNNGIFTVKALPVSVSLRANGGVYDGTAKSAEVISAISTVQGYDADKVRAELTDVLTFSYTGVTMGGVAYNSDTAPADAGSYMASVVGVSSNFTLLTTPSVSFTIGKKTIAEGEIKIASQVYDGGKNLIPEISDTDDYTVTVGEYTVAGTHGVMLTLKDANNTQWQGTTQNFCIVDFVVTPANNSVTLPLSIEGWTYGSAANAPSFAVKYESAYTFRYYDANGNLLNGVPANAGTYSVTVSVAGAADWNALPESERVPFTIAKYALNTPKLVIVSEGEGKNDTFTGGELRVRVTGYDHLLMSINYAGNSVVNGNEVTLIALNAGGYGVTFSLADADNYSWIAASGVTLEAGSATVGWTVNRMQVNKPKPGNNKLVVNGSVLVYLPEGFDPDIMYIKDNEAGYGGSFKATVGLIDPENYEWAETGNTVEEYYAFRIVGANTVFIAVICSVSGVALVAAGAACTQVILHKRKKRLAEESMDEMDRTSGDGSNKGSVTESASQGGNE